ncbi:MAG: HlyD family efflux transporter periplasmic adaptor subunit [Rhodanobacter sp.]
MLQQHDTALQNLVQLKELNGQAFQLRQQSEQLQGQLNQLPATVSGKRNDTEGQLADVAQSLAQNAAHRAVLLRAPADGTVANVLVHPGQTVTAQQPLLTVLPAHAQLLAELWVPSRSVGFIHTGEPVVMRYQAYPYFYCVTKHA